MSSFDNPAIMTRVIDDPMLSIVPTGEQASHGDVFESAFHANTLDALSNSRGLALQEAVQNRNKAVKDATGQDLEDPTQNGYLTEALRRFHAEAGPLSPDPDQMGARAMQGLSAEDLGLAPADVNRVHELQVQTYQEQVDDLAKRYPAAPIGGDIQTDAKTRANQAVAGAAATYRSSEGGFGNWLASMGGGMAAAVRDPLQVGALFAGGGEADVLKSVAGQYLETFLRQGAVNAGVQALTEPGVQAWRSQRGQEAGLVPALEDVGNAFLFGGALGTGFHALGALADKLRGSPAEARALADKMPDVAGEARAALNSVAADHEAAVGAPKDLPPGDAAARVRDMARAMEDPARPLAEPFDDRLPDSMLPPDTSRDARSDAARADAAPDALSRLLGEEETPVGRGLETPREIEPAKPATAVAAENGPSLQERILEAYAAAPDATGVTGGWNRRVPISEIRDRLPDVPREELDATLAAMHAQDGFFMSGSDNPREFERKPAWRDGGLDYKGERMNFAWQTREPAAEVAAKAQPKPPSRRAMAAAADKRAPETLRAFIKRLGGVRDETGELRHLVREYPGLVNNKRGMQPDKAREAAAEMGYLGPVHEAMGGTRVADLLDALHEHPRYSYFDEAKVAAREVRAELDERRQQIDSELSAQGSEKPDAELRDLAAQMLVGDRDLTVGDALERAGVQLYERDVERDRAAEEGAPPQEIDYDAVLRADRDQDYGGPRGREGPGAAADAGGAPQEVPADTRLPGENGRPEAGEGLKGLPEGDPLGKVPVERDGHVVLIDPSQIREGEERLDRMAGLIENCIL